MHLPEEIYKTWGPDIALPALPTDDDASELHTAWWMAQSCKLAYIHYSLAIKPLWMAGFTKIRFFDHQDTQAFLAIHENEEKKQDFAILAFRGTEGNFTDILTDIKLFSGKTREGNFKAHNGFVSGIQQVWGKSYVLPYGDTIKVYPPPNLRRLSEGELGEGIGDELSMLDYRIPVYITGHSLGGALATLAAYRAIQLGLRPENIHLYTFGSPRVTKRELAKYINDNLQDYDTIRMVNFWDIVPRVPILFGYTHVDHLTYLDPKGNWVKGKTKAYQWFTNNVLILPLALVDIFLEIILHWATLSYARPWKALSIRNHAIDDYISKLQTKIAAGKEE